MPDALFDHDTPLALPVWPRELERQFYLWLPREPWPTEELCFVPDAQAQDARRPCLSPALWTRFFLWRSQKGFGPPSFFSRLVLAVHDVDRRRGDLRQAITTQSLVPADPWTETQAARWVYEPFYAVFEALDLGAPEHLYHRETVKKLRRLRLLPAPEEG